MFRYNAREIEINIICDFFFPFSLSLSTFIGVACPMKIHEKSFKQQEIRRLTCYGIIISYTRSNKNINKNKKETYLRINFIFTALTYAVFGLLLLLDFSFFLLQFMHVVVVFFFFAYILRSPNIKAMSWLICYRCFLIANVVVRGYYLSKLVLN